MITNWIEISLLGFGICLSTCYFIRSCYLKRIGAKKMDLIQNTLDDGLLEVGQEMLLADLRIHQIELDIKELLIRTSFVETRLEERNAALFISATLASVPEKIAPKRGRPRKIKP